MHNNPKHTLSVFPTTGGAVNPGNDVEIVDELPIEIAASAETGYAFKNWVFMEGEGFAVLGHDVTDSSNDLIWDDAEEE